MPIKDNIGRRHCIPVIYTRGTHYEVGFDVGRTFESIIKSFLGASGPLNEEYLPLYDTPAGRRVYDATLSAVTEGFPQYVQELRGTADGAKVPFHKLFLLHMDNITPNVVGNQSPGKSAPTGCSTVCVNQPGTELLCHTEDALSEVLNHFYLVSAHILPAEDTEAKGTGTTGPAEERFTSLCYAGHLPGYTMGYNHHGLVYSINTLSAANLKAGKTPRHFITRALLSADNFVTAQQVLRNRGCGAGDGCSANLTFLNQPGDRLFHNAEMGPALDGQLESQLDIFTASPGEYIMHCNKYLRLPVVEVDGVIIKSSEARMTSLLSHRPPKCREQVLHMLGDQSRSDFNVFQESGPDDFVKTIAVGVFDCINRTWSLYADNPKNHDSLIEMPLILKGTTDY